MGVSCFFQFTFNSHHLNGHRERIKVECKLLLLIDVTRTHFVREFKLESKKEDEEESEMPLMTQLQWKCF